MKVTFTMRSRATRDAIFPAALLERLWRVAEPTSPEVFTDLDSAAAREALARTDVLITGWGAPTVDGAVLDRAPRLRLLAHSAGTVRFVADPEVWRRGVTVTTAAEANGIPVAEYTLAMILLAGKRTLQAAAQLRTERTWLNRETLNVDAGNLGGVVGVIGASRVGRRVLGLLRPFTLRVLLSDPYVTAAEAAELGAELVDLDTLVAASDVVSLHAPILPSTIGMMGARQFDLMRDGATFINTARGVLVDHDALRRHAGQGRIAAVLDVSDPEPLPADDPLYDLPNVLLTPHIAGSMGNELPLMGEYTVTEVERFAAGEPPVHPVTLADLERVA